MAVSLVYCTCTHVNVHVGFARWLNHILTPVDEYGQVMPRPEGAGKLVHPVLLMYPLPSLAFSLVTYTLCMTF